MRMSDNSGLAGLKILHNRKGKKLNREIRKRGASGQNTKCIISTTKFNKVKEAIILEKP